MIWLWRLIIISIVGGLFVSAYFGSFLLLSLVIIALIVIDSILDLKDEKMKRANLIRSRSIDQEKESIVTVNNISKIDD